MIGICQDWGRKNVHDPAPAEGRPLPATVTEALRSGFFSTNVLEPDTGLPIDTIVHLSASTPSDHPLYRIVVGEDFAELGATPKPVQTSTGRITRNIDPRCSVLIKRGPKFGEVTTLRFQFRTLPGAHVGFRGAEKDWARVCDNACFLDVPAAALRRAHKIEVYVDAGEGVSIRACLTIETRSPRMQR